jgi:hypothetical protein
MGRERKIEFLVSRLIPSPELKIIIKNHQNQYLGEKSFLMYSITPKKIRILPLKPINLTQNIGDNNFKTELIQTKTVSHWL